jgi:hypothetical protein
MRRLEQSAKETAENRLTVFHFAPVIRRWFQPGKFPKTEVLFKEIERATKTTADEAKRHRGTGATQPTFLPLSPSLPPSAAGTPRCTFRADTEQCRMVLKDPASILFDPLQSDADRVFRIVIQIQSARGENSLLPRRQLQGRADLRTE